MTNEILFTGINLDYLLEAIGSHIREEFKKHLTTKDVNGPAQFYTRKQVSKLLKISLPTLNEWTKTGRIQSYKIGSRVLYNRLEVQETIESKATFKYKKGGRYEA
jgi:excisionase family DNA binding protein